MSSFSDETPLISEDNYSRNFWSLKKPKFAPTDNELVPAEMSNQQNSTEEAVDQAEVAVQTDQEEPHVKRVNATPSRQIQVRPLFTEEVRQAHLYCFIAPTFSGWKWKENISKKEGQIFPFTFQAIHSLFQVYCSKRYEESCAINHAILLKFLSYH